MRDLKFYSEKKLIDSYVMTLYKCKFVCQILGFRIMNKNMEVDRPILRYYHGKAQENHENPVSIGNLSST